MKQDVKLRYLSIFFIFSMLTACASTESSTSTTAPAATSNAAAINTTETETKDAEATEERLVCRNEKTIGSNKKVRTCRKVVGS